MSCEVAVLPFQAHANYRTLSIDFDQRMAIKLLLIIFLILIHKICLTINQQFKISKKCFYVVRYLSEVKTNIFHSNVIYYVRTLCKYDLKFFIFMSLSYIFNNYIKPLYFSIQTCTTKTETMYLFLLKNRLYIIKA